jgi:hypothetical protein
MAMIIGDEKGNTLNLLGGVEPSHRQQINPTEPSQPSVLTGFSRVTKFWLALNNLSICVSCLVFHQACGVVVWKISTRQRGRQEDVDVVDESDDENRGICWTVLMHGQTNRGGKLGKQLAKRWEYLDMISVYVKFLVNHSLIVLCKIVLLFIEYVLLLESIMLLVDTLVCH